MASGLFALLDDIAVIAKMAAASLDDVMAGAAKAGAKSAGVIIDDAAVSPQYVANVSAARELPVVKKIAMGSLINKFLYIIPVAMLLTWLAPWALPFLLIIGGSYLCFEGAEKVAQWVGLLKEHNHTIEAGGDANAEKKLVSSAVRTDLILSTEIMLIALASIEGTSWIQRLAILIVVGLLMTVLVYGAVAVLVKLDDIGAWMARTKTGLAAKFGTGLVKAMPGTFNVIGVIGTLAMLWVGGHILVKSLSDVGFKLFYDFFHSVTVHVEHFGGAAVWLVDTLLSAVGGLLIGGILAVVILSIQKIFSKNSKASETAH